MDVEITMPDLATTEAEVKVVRWLAEVGETVERGAPLLEVETDKAATEVESLASGVLKEIRAEPGDEVAVGDVIAIITVIAAIEPKEGAPAKRAGMFAKNREAAKAKAEAKATIPLSLPQRKSAERMQQAKRSVPHFYLQTSANAEPMAAAREAADGEKLLWDAFFVYAAARALGRFERMGCRFEEDHLVPHGDGAVGVAVDLDGDLFVVPISDAAAKAPARISREIRTLVARIRDGDAEAKRLRPAAITVTNLGMANVESFIPIVSPPESAILGVGKVAQVAAVQEGRVIAQHRVTLTLSVDHRVANGKYAADFLDAIVEELEMFRGEP